MCGVCLLAALAGSYGAEPAQAQRITRWFDEKGIVHFSTSPPPPGVKYEMLNLPVVSTESSKSKKSPEQAKSGAVESTTSQEDARIVLKEKDSETVGPSSREFRGTVKNVGGERARDVSVVLSVFEDGQGNDCLQNDLRVKPSSLKPGETGTYSVVLESPCFFGRPRIQITPRWEEAAAR